MDLKERHGGIYKVRKTILKFSRPAWGMCLLLYGIMETRKGVALSYAPEQVAV